MRQLLNNRLMAHLNFYFQLPSKEVEKLCPVCRMELDPSIDIEKLLQAPPASEDLEVEIVIPVSGSSVYDQKLQDLYNKQRDQGGIIDLSDTSKRLLVISSPVAPAPEGSEPPSPVPPPALDKRAPSRHPPRSHHHHASRHHYQPKSHRRPL